MKRAKSFRIILLLVALILAICIAFATSIFLTAQRALNPKEPAPISQEEALSLSRTLDALYPERASYTLKPLPYTIQMPELNIAAKSAILVDTKSGCILYEKNAELPIPPASLTKIVEMYVVFEAIENNEVSLESIVPLPPDSWSRNLPQDASRMFLDQGQIVTLSELLLGLSIASANDASIAVAHFISGNMEDFVQRMNTAVTTLGLKHTHFVESSGYSEKNITTAKDFASFSRTYIERWPFALAQFHSQKELLYPTQKNVPATTTIQTISQKNTNKLLSVLEGCDGLKTGFIYESGYNIAVTAEQNGTRFLSVTLGGPGANTAEGNKYRVQDNMALFNWAFSHFADFEAPPVKPFLVSVLGSKTKEVRLVPAFNQALTVPFITGASPKESAENVRVTANVPKCLFGSISQGTQYGTLSYQVGQTTLLKIPLVAETDAEDISAHKIKYACNKIVYNFVQKQFSR